MSPTPRLWRTVALASLCGLVTAPLIALPAQAAPDGSGVVISEAYLSGGSAGAAFQHKFVELFNPTDAPVSLDGMAVQYRGTTNLASAFNVAALSGQIEAGGYTVVQMNSNGTNGAPLTTPAGVPLLTFDRPLSPSGTNGSLALTSNTTPLTGDQAAVSANAQVVDLLGYSDTGVPGVAATFESTVFSKTVANNTPRSIVRAAGADTDDNSADFKLTNRVTPGAVNLAYQEVVTPPVDPGTAVTKTIAEIQGTGAASPLVGTVVTATGVVTAAYGTGGLDGYYIQTAGTGGSIDLATHAASDGIFVYSPATSASVAVGDSVTVTGTVAEYYGLTQINVVHADNLVKLSTPLAAIKPVKTAFPKTDAQREVLEGMLIEPTGDFTVSNVYDANRYGSIGLAAATTPFVNPTAAGALGSPEHKAALDRVAAEAVVLDDGSSWDFTKSDNTGIPLPYLDTTNPVRVGAAATLTKPVVLDYRNGSWVFEPQVRITGDNADDAPATFENTRTAAPKDVGGDIKLATFNVLNYFSTVGEDRTGCTFYTDRAGNKVTVNSSDAAGCGVRGAATKDALARQQSKIVAAINALDADVVSLEEIENSAKIGPNRDAALETLVAALNKAAGKTRWAFVSSPAAVPAIADEDVIRTAFIYDPTTIKTVGESTILIGDPAFKNAREPDAQAFTPLGGSDDDTFLVIANHFKSKSDSNASGDNVDNGEGAYTGDRTRQAQALVKFADTVKAKVGTDKVYLVGDFNSYDYEAPLTVLKDAGYISQGAKTGKFTYAYDGAVGSLDHVFASAAADKTITGQDIWNINSVESIALEYSRHNYNAKNLFVADAYRSSDHDPVIVGINTSADITTLNLLNINDFHGRINDSVTSGSPTGTLQFAGTVEGLRTAYGEKNSALLSAGDNIGASEFASSSQKDQPTIDVLNILDLKASAVGNHEFDQGIDDLVDRVIDDGKNAKFPYLGANVYLKGTKTPLLDEYTVVQLDGVRVAVIGAITEETPTLVSAAGIAGVDFGDPVEAVNRVAAKITAGDLADVIVAEYHEGASAGTPDGSSLEKEIEHGGAFADIVTKTTADVDAIFTGHTHKQYAWQAPVPGAKNGETRPVVQTGSYGEYIGQAVLTVDRATDEVLVSTATNVPRVKSASADLVTAFPRVAAVKVVLDKALADSAILGGVAVGEATAPITRALTADGKEDRGSESALGSLVAESLLSSLKAESRGGADIGVVNPGGMRAELDAGTITYAEANAVLPFLNNLWTTTLTGAQFKTVLEQQWQTNADGSVASRPYLQLGLSSNVNYTFDASAEAGKRITSITVNGKPIDPAADYRIGSFSFLLAGGDNFREFAKGTNTKDTGLVDRDAWVDYLTANKPVAPNFARNGVSVTGAPTSAKPGESVSLTLGTLDRTSTGSPKNTSVLVEVGGEAVGTSAITATGGQITFTVPASATAGASEIVLTAAQSGTVVRVPLTISATAPVLTPADESELTDALKDLVTAPAKIERGDSVDVTIVGATGSQQVTSWLYSTPVALTDGIEDTTATGTLSVTVPADAPLGAHRLSVQDETGTVIGWTPVEILAAAVEPTTTPTDGSTASPTDGATTAPTDGSVTPGTGSGNGNGNGSGSGGLSETGANVLGVSLIAVLLLLAGAGAFFARRRRVTEAGVTEEG